MNKGWGDKNAVVEAIKGEEERQDREGGEKEGQREASTGRWEKGHQVEDYSPLGKLQRNKWTVHSMQKKGEKDESPF